MGRENGTAAAGYTTDFVFLRHGLRPREIEKPFRILNFTDSTGCTSCKLKLLTWNAYVREIDTTLADKVDFLFYFHPQNERELGLILRADGFELPFYIDRKMKSTG